MKELNKKYSYEWWFKFYLALHYLLSVCLLFIYEIGDKEIINLVYLF